MLFLKFYYGYLLFIVLSQQTRRMHSPVQHVLIWFKTNMIDVFVSFKYITTGRLLVFTKKHTHDIFEILHILKAHNNWTMAMPVKVSRYYCWAAAIFIETILKNNPTRILNFKYLKF